MYVIVKGEVMSWLEVKGGLQEEIRLVIVTHQLKTPDTSKTWSSVTLRKLKACLNNCQISLYKSHR